MTSVCQSMTSQHAAQQQCSSLSVPTTNPYYSPHAPPQPPQPHVPAPEHAAQHGGWQGDGYSQPQHHYSQYGQAYSQQSHQPGPASPTNYHHQLYTPGSGASHAPLGGHSPPFPTSPSSAAPNGTPRQHGAPPHWSHNANPPPSSYHAAHLNASYGKMMGGAHMQGAPPHLQNTNSSPHSTNMPTSPPTSNAGGLQPFAGGPSMGGKGARYTNNAAYGMHGMCMSAGNSSSSGRRGSSCSITDSEWTTGSSQDTPPFTPPRTPSPLAATPTGHFTPSQPPQQSHHNNRSHAPTGRQNCIPQPLQPYACASSSVCSGSDGRGGSNSDPPTPTSGLVTAHNPYALTGPIPVEPPSPTMMTTNTFYNSGQQPSTNNSNKMNSSGRSSNARKGHQYGAQPLGVQKMTSYGQANLDAPTPASTQPKYNNSQQQKFSRHQFPPMPVPASASLVPAAAPTRQPCTTPAQPLQSPPAAVAPPQTPSPGVPEVCVDSSLVSEERKDLRRYESLARDPNVRSRFDFLYAMLAGRLVELQLKDGTRYQGIFHSKVPREFSLKLMQVRLVSCSVYGPTSHSRPRTSLRVNDCDIAYLSAIEVPHDEEGYEELL